MEKFEIVAQPSTGKIEIITKLMKIGYWYSKHEPHLPRPEATDIPVDPAFLEKLEEIIKNPGTERIEYLGYSPCRLCDKSDNGDSDILLGEEYTFPDGLLHYYKVHNVRPDPDFVKFVMSWKCSPPVQVQVQVPGQIRKLYERLKAFEEFYSGMASIRYTT